MNYTKTNKAIYSPLCYTARTRIKKQAPRLLRNPTVAHDNSIKAATLKFAGFVQHRFHCMPVGRNETLVIMCR